MRDIFDKILIFLESMAEGFGIKRDYLSIIIRQGDTAAARRQRRFGCRSAAAPSGRARCRKTLLPASAPDGRKRVCFRLRPFTTPPVCKTAFRADRSGRGRIRIADAGSAARWFGACAVCINGGGISGRPRLLRRFVPAADACAARRKTACRFGFLLFSE